MNRLSRRDWMISAAAAGCLPFTGAFAAESPAGVSPDSLNGIAHSRGLGYGSCINTGGTFGPNPAKRTKRPGSYDDPKFRELFIAQCGALVPSNELKWYALRPSADKFDFRRADILAAFAHRHKIAMRGHTLLWNRDVWLPKWLENYDFGSNPAAKAEHLLTNHISTVCKHYGTRIFSYDVINEGISPDTGEIEKSVFNKYLGIKTYEIAFHTARQNAPHAQLVYNDYMSWRPKDATHCKGVLKLLEYFKKNDVPVDALGVQSHIGSSKEPLDAQGFEVVDEKAWRKFLDEVTAMGFDLVITEFDVNDRHLPADFATRDRLVAEHGKRYLDLMLSYPRLRYVMSWGLVDKYSWLQGNTPRPDGLPKRDLPYDSEYQPVKLRQAMAEAFAAAPERPLMNVKPA